MSKDKEKTEQETNRDFRTPHSRFIHSLPNVIFTSIISKEHKHHQFVKNFELVNGQPVSTMESQKIDSIKNMSKYRVGDFSIITLDNIGLQSLRPQSYSPDIDSMLATIK